MIYGGVVLKDNPFIITFLEQGLLSHDQLDEKYYWLGGAPNLQVSYDVSVHGTVVRAKVPCITELGVAK